MAEISFPLGILSFLKDWLTKRLFLNSYITSHQEYLKWKHFPVRHKLGHFFEYDLHLESCYISNSETPLSYLVVQNISDTTIERVEFVVEATSGDTVYQDSAIISGMAAKKYKINLPRIPLQNLDVSSDGRIFSTYNRVKVLSHILDENIDELKRDAASREFTPMLSEFLNSSWSRKWGNIWNLDFIEECKREVQGRIQHYLTGRNYWPARHDKISFWEHLAEYRRQFLGVPLSWLLTNRIPIWLIFWVPVFLRLRILNSKQPHDA